MTRRHTTWPLLAVAVALLLCVGAVPALAVVGDFSFAHTSDDHNQPLTPKTISEFIEPQPVPLDPYKVTALPVSFVVDTGDMTEFGGHEGFMQYMGYFDKVKIPHYLCVGNHDGTWRSLTYEVRQQFGAPYYSFDKFGCHFVILDSSGLQHPFPSITAEQTSWLKKDLEKTGPNTPVFIGFHHPPSTTEFSSKWEVDRLFDILRPYNIAVIMYGHGHNASHEVYKGFDCIQGGSTYGPGQAGYQVYYITDNTLRVAYKGQGQPTATTGMLEKSLLPPAKRYPKISIASPKEGGTYSAQVPMKIWVGLGKGDIKEAFVEVDGENKTSVSLKQGGAFEGSVPLASLSAGAHYMTATFAGVDGSTYTHSTFFYKDSTLPKVQWRVLMDTASKTTPAVSDKMVYIGGYDGTVRAYDVKTGTGKWRFQTKGAIAGQILLAGDKVYVGSEDRKLYCLTADKGKKLWEYESEEPIYSAPVSDGKAIYFGCGNGAFYSVNAKTGAMNWKNNDATYNIEIKPFVANGKVYYGAWDCYVYCLNTADGKLIWKCQGKGSSEGGAARYYSPADCGPVVCKGNVFVADRKYRCALIDDVSGKIGSSLDSIAAITLSKDGDYVYMRQTDGKVSKVDSTGKNVWTAEVPADWFPAEPTECNGVVYVCGKRGTVSAISASDGKLLWQYDSTPSSYVLAGVGASGSTAFVVGTVGSLTALSAK